MHKEYQIRENAESKNRGTCRVRTKVAYFSFEFVSAHLFPSIVSNF